MLRTLTITAIAGFLISAACLAGAIALGGRDISLHGWRHHPFIDFTFDDLGDKASGPPTTREIPWSADHELIFTYGGDVHYTQGPEHKMTVTGPADLVNRLHMDNGRLRLDDNRPFVSHAPLSVEITAPDIDSFKIYGACDLDIASIDRDRVNIEINGNGDVKASGKAHEVDVEIRGSGNVDVAAVASSAARVAIMGSGDTSIAPADSADIEIAGSGDVTLESNPAHIDTDIKGSGEIRRRPKAPEPAPAAPSAGAPAPPASRVGPI